MAFALLLTFLLTLYIPLHTSLPAPMYIYFVISSTFRKVFDTRSQDVVDVCLEMFNCVPAEQTVAMRKAKFLKRVSNSSNMLCQTFAAEAAKEPVTL